MIRYTVTSPFQRSLLYRPVCDISHFPIGSVLGSSRRVHLPSGLHLKSISKILSSSSSPVDFVSLSFSLSLSSVVGKTTVPSLSLSSVRPGTFPKSKMRLKSFETRLHKISLARAITYSLSGLRFCLEWVSFPLPAGILSTSGSVRDLSRRFLT